MLDENKWFWKGLVICNAIHIGYYMLCNMAVEPLRQEKINLMSKSAKLYVLHNFPCNKLFIIKLGVFEYKSIKCTHFDRSSFYGTTKLNT